MCGNLYQFWIRFCSLNAWSFGSFWRALVSYCLQVTELLVMSAFTDFCWWIDPWWWDVEVKACVGVEITGLFVQLANSTLICVISSQRKPNTFLSRFLNTWLVTAFSCLHIQLSNCCRWVLLAATFLKSYSVSLSKLAIWVGPAFSLISYCLTLIYLCLICTPLNLVGANACSSAWWSNPSLREEIHRVRVTCWTVCFEQNTIFFLGCVCSSILEIIAVFGTEAVLLACSFCFYYTCKQNERIIGALSFFDQNKIFCPLAIIVTSLEVVVWCWCSMIKGNFVFVFVLQDTIFSCYFIVDRFTERRS